MRQQRPTACLKISYLSLRSSCCSYKGAKLNHQELTITCCTHLVDVAPRFDVRASGVVSGRNVYLWRLLPAKPNLQLNDGLGALSVGEMQCSHTRRC